MTVSVLVVSWGRADVTERFLRSASTYPVLWFRNEVGRDRERMDAVERAHPEVAVLPSARNVGFAGAVNRLMEQVSTRFALICNNDVVLGRDAPDRVAADWRDDLAVLGAMTDRGGPQAHRAVKGAPRWKSGESWRTYDGRLRGNRAPIRVVDRLALSFSCVLVSRESWEAVGPLDESLGLAYGEDNDWCHRARLAGLTVAFTPNVLVHHDHGASTGANLERRLRRKGTAALRRKWGRVV